MKDAARKATGGYSNSASEDPSEVAIAAQHTRDLDPLISLAIEQNVSTQGKASDPRQNIVTPTTCPGGVRKNLALAPDLRDESISCLDAVLCNVDPNLDQIGLGRP
jgi:hypothetical protein